MAMERVAEVVDVATGYAVVAAEAMAGMEAAVVVWTVLLESSASERGTTPS